METSLPIIMFEPCTVAEENREKILVSGTFSLYSLQRTYTLMNFVLSVGLSSVDGRSKIRLLGGFFFLRSYIQFQYLSNYLGSIFPKNHTKRNNFIF